MKRNELIGRVRELSEQVWDIVVIGGGATGLGIALDASTRGYRTLLLEQSDFAKGTSSRSTKLVHGGVRYMAQGDLFLVMEALHERGLMLKNAAHLTTNQEFVIPVYTWWDAIMYTVGLKFYDLLAGRLSLGKSSFINRKKAVERLPLLRRDGLKGGVVYHDGQFDDSRMAVALALSCADHGGTVLNYFRVNSFLRNTAGKIEGVSAQDMISGEEFTVKAKLVVNATGVFADSIARMDDPAARISIKPSQGVHLVLDNSFLQGNSAIMIPKTEDGRVLFAIPWYGKVVVGTTDTPLNEISLEPVALDSEIDFILRTAGKYLLRPPGRTDILCVFAGLRPLAADPDNPEATREVSRRHKITLSPSGLLTIVGGKWTTYRRMAEETINKAIRAGFLEKRKCVTRDLPLSAPWMSVSPGSLHVYGDRAPEIRKMMIESPDSAQPVNPRLPYTRAEIAWICRNEMPVTLEDILARRTRALFLDARASAESAGEVASIMAEEFGYGTDWKNEQVEFYNKLVKNYIRE